MHRPRWDSHKKDGRSGCFVARGDRRQPLQPVFRVRRAGLGNAQDLRGDGVALILRQVRWIIERVGGEVRAQAGERFGARMRRQRFVGGVAARLRDGGGAGRRIGGEVLKIVAQLGAAPEEIDAVLDALARIGERAGEFGQVGQPRLKDDIAQIHRTVVAVEASDGAVVVGERVDGNDDGAITMRLGVDGAHEERPAARRRSRHAGIEKTKLAAGSGGCCGGIEPGVGARIAEHQHVAARLRGEGTELSDGRLKAAGSGRGIEHAAIERRAERDDVDQCKDRECGRNEKGGRLLAWRSDWRLAPQRPLCEKGLEASRRLEAF